MSHPRKQVGPSLASDFPVNGYFRESGQAVPVSARKGLWQFRYCIAASSRKRSHCYGPKMLCRRSGPARERLLQGIWTRST